MGPETGFQSILLSAGGSAGLAPPGGGEPKRPPSRRATAERIRHDPPRELALGGPPGVQSSVDTKGIVYFVPLGAFTPRDVQQAVQRLFHDSSVQPPRRILWDLRGVDGKEDMAGWGYDQVRELADFTVGSRPGERGRNAFLVASEVTYGLCRMYEMLVDTSKLEHQVFRDHAAAVEWLLQEF